MRLYDGGRSTDGWVRGTKVTNLSQVKNGTVLICVSHQFKSENLIFVMGLSSFPLGFNYFYANPDTLERTDGGDMLCNAFELLDSDTGIGRYEYFEASTDKVIRHRPLPPMPGWLEEQSNRPEFLIDCMIQLAQAAYAMGADAGHRDNLESEIEFVCRELRGVSPSDMEVSAICDSIDDPTIYFGRDAQRCQLCDKATGKPLDGFPQHFLDPDDNHPMMAERGFVWVPVDRIEDGYAIDLAPALEEPAERPTVRRCSLNVEEQAMLADYAAKQGRTWKSKLRDEWMKASGIGTVHHLRNVHYFGPKGLIKHKLDGLRCNLREDEPHTWDTGTVEIVANYLAASMGQGNLERLLADAENEVALSRPWKHIPSVIKGRTIVRDVFAMALSKKKSEAA